MPFKIRKLYFSQKFLDNIHFTNDRNRLLVIQRHHAIMHKNGSNFIITHLNETQNITFFNQNIDLIPYFVSENDIFNTGKSQYITGPSYNFSNILDNTVIEIEYYKNTSNIKTIDGFIKKNYDQLKKVTEEITDKQAFHDCANGF